MFESKRHKEYKPLKLPAKTSEEDRPANQHGYIAPNGSEWSVMAEIVGAHATIPGTTPDNFTVRLTIAPREAGKTKRVDGLPVVRYPHDLPIQDFQLESENFDIEAVIEDAVVLMTEKALKIETKQSETLGKLAKLGLDVNITKEERKEPRQ